MLHQPPKTESTAKAKKQKQEELILPQFTTEELDKIINPAAVHQEILQMRHKGVSPFHSQLMKEAVAEVVVADVADAVRWHNSKNEEMEALKLQDTDDKKTWLSDVIEDFTAYEVYPYSTASEIKIVLKELDKELDIKLDTILDIDAKNYIHNLKKELDLILEKL